jgi:hypothetical protein
MLRGSSREVNGCLPGTPPFQGCIKLALTNAAKVVDLDWRGDLPFVVVLLWRLSRRAW